MSFFGPGSLLSGYEPSPPGGLDPALYKALMSAFPGLQSLGGQQGQQPASLQSLGYQGMGPQFFQGQGSGSFQNLSPFEGAKGFGSESITGGLASGTIGKSQSQQTPTGSGLLSLPQLQLPQAIASQQASYGGGDMMGSQAEPGGGVTIGAGDVLNAGQQVYDLFGGTSLGTQTTTPGYAEQRAGERASYSATPLPSTFSPNSQVPVYGGGSVSSQLATAGYDQGLPGGSSVTSQLEDALASGTGGETIMAPGGSAQTALGQAPQGDLLGGGISTLQGLMSLYGGAQSGDIGQILSGGAGTLGGLGQMAPAQVQALEAALGVAPGALGLAAGGLGGLAGGYGLYQGIQQGDPIQALMGAGGLYAGAAPLINAALGTSLPTLSSLGSSALGAIGGGTAAAGGAAGGAGAGVGAAAGGLGAGLTAGIVASPLIAGYLGGTIEDMIDAEAEMRRGRAQQQQFQRGLPTAFQDISAAPGLLDQIGPDTTPEQAAQIYEQLQTMQRNWQGGEAAGPNAPGYESAMAGGGTVQGSFLPTGDRQALTQSIGPYMAALDLGRLRAQDIMQRAGMAAPAGGWTFTPEIAAQTFGSQRSYFDPESGASTPNTLRQNPWLQANYLAGQPGYDPNAPTSANTWAETQWAPGALAAFKNIQPGGLEQGLRDLFGGTQGENQLGFNPYFTGEAQRAWEASPEYQQNQQYMQALQQYQQQLGTLQGQLPQLAQAAQVAPTTDPGALAALQASSGFSSAPNAGGSMNQGVDLMALLRQMGYAV